MKRAFRITVNHAAETATYELRIACKVDEKNGIIPMSVFNVSYQDQEVFQALFNDLVRLGFKEEKKKQTPPSDSYKGLFLSVFFKKISEAWTLK